MDYKIRDQLGDKGWLERDIDKARPSYFTARYELLMFVNVRCDLSGHISRGNILTLALQQLIGIKKKKNFMKTPSLG